MKNMFGADSDKRNTMLLGEKSGRHDGNGLQKPVVNGGAPGDSGQETESEALRAFYERVSRGEREKKYGSVSFVKRKSFRIRPFWIVSVIVIILLVLLVIFIIPVQKYIWDKEREAKKMEEMQEEKWIYADYIDVSGMTDQNLVRKIIREHFKDVQACYRESWPKPPYPLGGAVTIMWVIESDGQISRSVLENMTLEKPEVGQCILDLYTQLSYPAPSEGRSMVRMAIQFYP